MGNKCETWFDTITGHHKRLDEFMAACTPVNDGLPKEFDATNIYGDSYCRRLSPISVELVIITSWESPEDEIEAMMKAWPWLLFQGHNTTEEYGSTDSWDNSEQQIEDPYQDEPNDDEIKDKSEAISAELIRVLKSRGLKAEWEFPGYVEISLGNGYEWAFGTADGEMWGSDLRRSGDGDNPVFSKNTDYSVACENAEALADSIQRVMADPVAAAAMPEVNEDANQELLGLCQWVMATIDAIGDDPVKLQAIRMRAQVTFNQWENV